MVDASLERIALYRASLLAVAALDFFQPARRKTTDTPSYNFNQALKNGVGS